MADTKNKRVSHLDNWAAAYEKKHGHVPLIINREYEYFGDFVRLVCASYNDVNVTVANRHEERTICDKEELEWKPHPADVFNK